MRSRDILGSDRIATGFQYSEQEYQHNKAIAQLGQHKEARTARPAKNKARVCSMQRKRKLQRRFENAPSELVEY